jgi:murein DD-endopeptidase MepM/ murein hydrolase activator NlpD
MSTIDIVARLQLRAEQFSSETGARFAEMKSRAQSAATGIRQEFNGAFAEVQKLAGNALTMPRTQSGSLDLSGEIAQLRAAAAASDQQAVSLRELSMAQMAAAGSGRADAEALRLEADAAAVGSLAAERAAASTRDRIGALQAVQAELNRSTSATTIHTEAGAKYVASAGAQRQSTMMMGQQLQDFIVQTSNGTAVTTAFSQQIGQMAFALQGMGGRAAAVGAFLGSMAGTGVMVLLTMTPLIAKLIEGNNALDDAVDKLAKDAEQSDVTRKAKEQFGKSIEGVTAALKDQEEALKKVAEAENTAAEQANIAAKRERDRAVDVRKTTVALLEQAIAQAEVYKVQSQAPGQRGELATLGLSEATNRVAGLQDQLAAAQAAVAQAERVVQGTRVDLAAETAKRMADPMAAINHMYDEQAKAARKAARDTAAANGQVTVSLTAQLTQIEKNREAAKKTEQERQAAERRNERAGPLTSFLSPVSGRVTGTFGEPRPGHTHGGIDYAVPVGTPVRAPAAGTIDVAGARGALGNAIYINFGGGTTGRFGHLSKFNVKPGDTVDAGDIIGYTGGARGEPGSGRSTGAHLHYEVRRNGKAVDPRTGRFPTDAGQAADDATKREQQALDAAKKLADFGDNAARSIAGINAQWDEQPRLIDRARLQAADLDAIIKDLRERQPPGFEKMIADAQKAKVVIVDGIDRPFREFIKSQKEGLAVGTLVLQGRDAEAEALQNALRIQQQQGPLDAAHLAAILEEAEQHQRISEALEDQRRLVGVYTGAVNNLQREFDDFLDAFEKRPGKAIGGIISGVLSTYKTAAKDLLSNAIFGGVDRDIEKYVRKMTGQQTPAEILADQAVDAGKELRGYVDTTGSALDEFVRVVRGASGALGSPSGMAPVGGLLSGDTLSDVMRDALGESSTLPIAANDNPEGEITVIGQRLDRNAQKMADAALKASDVFGVGIRGITGNLAKNFGIVVPDSIVKGLEKHLPSVLQGARSFPRSLAARRAVPSAVRSAASSARKSALCLARKSAACSASSPARLVPSQAACWATWSAACSPKQRRALRR